MAGPATTHLRQVVAVPYPGRGHINPMMNFCNLMASKTPDIQILVIVTQEWFGYLNSESDSSTRISFNTIPNVLPSEATRGTDLAGFLEALRTEMEGPIEKVLDTIQAPIDLIVADSFLGRAVDLGKRRNTQVASFWPASASTFLAVHHYDLIQKLLAGSTEERIEIPGIPSIRRVVLPGSFQPNNRLMADVVIKAISSATKSQCIVFRSLMELEAPAIQALKADLSCPIFTIGPAIPYFKTTHKTNTKPNYISWLDSQRERSVLYISLGSVMTTTNSQMDDLAAGLEASGVPFLWVAKNQAFQFSGKLGMVVSWCDQMRVLCHPSIGGFLMHCGWNSSIETAFAGVPALTFPLGFDQVMNSKIIVEDWGIGWRVKDRVDEFVGREAILLSLKRFMNLKCSERMELDRISKEFQARLLESVRDEGSLGDFDGFVSKMIRASELGDD